MGLFRKPKTFMCYCERVRAYHQHVIGLLGGCVSGQLFYAGVGSVFGRLSLDAQRRILKKARELSDLVTEELKNEYAGLL